MKKNNIRARKKWMIEASYPDVTPGIQAGLNKLLDPLKIDTILFASNSIAVRGLSRIQHYEL